MAAATADEVRDLGYIAWRDPWAWMETMKGKRWETLIQQEKRHFHELSSQPLVERTSKKMEEELEQARKVWSYVPPFHIGNGTIHLYSRGRDIAWNWSWHPSSRKHAYDLNVQGNIVWYITTEEDDRRSKNRLVCEDSSGRIIWTKPAVSTQIAVVNERCYYIKMIDYFRTIELCMCHAQTGRQERVLYREKNEENDLVLIKGANRSLYLQTSNPMSSATYRIDTDKYTLKPLYKNTTFQWPLGESIYGDDCVLTRNDPTEEWEIHGKPLIEWSLPKEGDIQWIHLTSGHVVTIFEGAQTIWWCEPNKKPRKVFHLKVGTIDPNIYDWDGALVNEYMIRTPIALPCMIHVTEHRVERVEQERNASEEKAYKALEQLFPPLAVHRFHATSRDNTSVPYVMVMSPTTVKPKALFVYVYGAYGSTTSVYWPYQTWYPLLKRDWAIVFAMVRGGGDIDAAWADAARREHRHLSVDDFEAVIRHARQKLRLGPEKTVIYGRSAGGVPVGAIVSRFPDGSLAGAAFTEVPYVDVLRTSSNPELPLTVGEYKEFGHPMEKILNFRELLNVSPINSIPADGAPGMFVMTHVGLLDRQVYAYESFKWIQRLRGAMEPEQRDASDPKRKYVTFERKEDHHYRPNHLSRFRAIDFAILDAWVEGRLRM